MKPLLALLPLVALGLGAGDPPKSPAAPPKPARAKAAPAKTEPGKAAPGKAAPGKVVPGPAVPAEAPDPDAEILVRATPYAPALKRDPFRSPTEGEESVGRSDLVEDIAVKGRMVSGGKSYAIVSDSRGNTRRLPVGHAFTNGVIVAIDDRAVTFHQWEVNTTNRKHFKVVVKAFKREEGKR